MQSADHETTTSARSGAAAAVATTHLEPSRCRTQAAIKKKGDRVNVQIDCGSHEEPSRLDDTLVGSSVYMRWEKYGWQLGRITDIVTHATPRVFKKFRTTA